MLDFSDQPYQWFPPRPNALVRWLLCKHNQWRYLPRTKRIKAVHVTGLESLAQARQRADRLILVPNHPTHADASILLEATRQAGLSTQVMAAYDVFLRSRQDAWVMQKLGAFSVDRESSDPRALKTALEIIERGRHALVIFPEGNVYLENDRVTPFNDGAAFLSLRAAKQLAASDHRVLMVPVSIKTTLIEDAKPAIASAIRSAASVVDLELPGDVTPAQALHDIGNATLHRHLKLRGLSVEPGDDLTQTINRAAGEVLSKLETTLELTPREKDSLWDRIRKARRVIHEVRADESRCADHAAAATWADQAMLAIRLVSYSGSYVATHPSVDRIAETTEKIAEDLFRRMMPPIADRQAHVHFADAIDLSEWVAEGRPGKKAIKEVTSRCEDAVQQGLDTINAGIKTPGSTTWTSAL